MADFDVDTLLESTFHNAECSSAQHPSLLPVSDLERREARTTSRPARNHDEAGRNSRKSRSRSRGKRLDERKSSKRRSASRKRSRSRSKGRRRRSRKSRRRCRSRSNQQRDDEPRGPRRFSSPSRHHFRQRSISNNEYRLDLKTGIMSLPEGRGSGADDLTLEERDARTVFCMQLSHRVRPRDLEEFFSSVGKVRDVKLITDTKTRRSKGIAYVEFYDLQSVPLALGLSGEKLMGAPVLVQQTQAEKNRLPFGYPSQVFHQGGPLKLFVGSLHYNIDETMLRGIFEPFGPIADISVVKDSETGRSKGYGYVTFRKAEHANKALEQLNGFELAGRAMKVGHVMDKSNHYQQAGKGNSLDSERFGFELGATARLELMAKLAEGTGLEIPAATANAISLSHQLSAPPVATQCFLISNMFDPVQLNASGNDKWDAEIRDDIIEECDKFGGVLHIYVDKHSASGNVYVKCPSVAIATACVSAFHGRWFAGRVITVAYIPVIHYHQLFPELSISATQILHSKAAAVDGLVSGAGGVFNQAMKR